MVKRLLKKSLSVFWTPRMFEKLVESYVFRTKITESFKKAISAMSEDQLLTRENGLKLVKLLFERDNEMKETYGTPEELMQDLFDYQNIPCNAEFLGLKDSLNYHSILVMFATQDNSQFCSIIDAYITFQRIVVEPHCKFTSLLAKSIGNWIGRYKKNTFELISFQIFQSLADYEALIRNNLECDNDFKHETIDDVYSFLSSYYYEDDVELLKTLRKMIDDENERRPFVKNPEIYEQICANHARFNATIKTTFVTSNVAEKSFLHGVIPTARLFDDNEKLHPDRRFFFAKELENALQMAMKKRQAKTFPKGLFPVETEEDRKLGILRIVEWKTYQKILKILDLPEDSVHVVLCVIEKTSRDNQIPINTPYGTYCVLAKYAFVDVFSQVTMGMQLFRGVNKENAPKIVEWFDNLDVFSESRRYVYFIETWKVDEIIDRAYQELQQYSTEYIDELSRTHFGRYDALQELLDFSPNFPYQDVLNICYKVCIKQQPQKRFSGRNVYSLYESAIFLAFVEANSKYSSFLAIQGLIDPDSPKNDKKVNHLTEKLEKTMKL